MANRTDPYRVYKFQVEVDGINIAGFSEASGLDSTQAPIEYREGTDALHSKQLPGLNKFSAISLKRGITDDKQFWMWRQNCMDGKVERKNGSIVLFDDTGTEKIRWNFTEAWPSKWTGPGMKASGNEVAIEAVELTHEGIKRG
jgi:phage tail-like protein